MEAAKRLLQDTRADVNVTGKNGLTALHVATHYDNLDVALLLMQHAANTHAVAKVTNPGRCCSTQFRQVTYPNQFCEDAALEFAAVGRLKMQDPKMGEGDQKDETLENAGPENEGPNSRTGICRTSRIKQ